RETNRCVGTAGRCATSAHYRLAQFGSGPAAALHWLEMSRDGQRLMIVMPHPDDECFGCASTIARYSAEGATVSLVTMTRGGAGLWNGREAGDLRRLADVREIELRDAAAELGVTFLETFDYPDGALERVEE